MQRPRNAKVLHRFTAVTIALALTGCGGEPNVDSSNAQIGGGTVELTVNRPPTIGGNPPAQVAIGDLYSFVPTADDPDGDSLVFTIAGEPAWANFDSATGRLWGEPGVADAGTHSGIQIDVTDGNDSAALSAFAITIVAQALGTVTISWTAPTENTDGTPLTDLAGFKVYIGTSAGNLPRMETISDPGTATYLIENLTPGTWFYAITAFNTSEIESIKSSVANWTYVP